jgi:hypothetical protein
MQNDGIFYKKKTELAAEALRSLVAVTMSSRLSDKTERWVASGGWPALILRLYLVIVLQLYFKHMHDVRTINQRLSTMRNLARKFSKVFPQLNMQTSAVEGSHLPQPFPWRL